MIAADIAVGFDNEGIRGAWKALATRSLDRIIRLGRGLIFAQPLAREIEIDPPTGVSIRVASRSDVPALARLVGHHEAGRLETLMAGGEHGLIAWRGEQAVGQLWWAERLTRRVILWPFPLRLPQHAVYFWNLYVLPRERNHGVGAALHSAGARAAFRAGFREGWRMVALSNTASLSVVRKSNSGIRIAGEVHFLELFARAYVRLVAAPLMTEVS